jgi:hypothetical protein
MSGWHGWETVPSLILAVAGNVATGTARLIEIPTPPPPPVHAFITVGPWVAVVGAVVLGIGILLYRSVQVRGSDRDGIRRG